MRRYGLPVAVLLVLTIGLPRAMADDPTYPSAKDVQRSKQRAQQKATQVGRIEAQLTQANTRMQQLNITASRAAEAYNGAILKLKAAQQAAAEARQRAGGAHHAVDVANVRKGQLAAASYRMGGAVGGYGALLDADGPQTMMDQAATLEYLGQRHKNVLDQANAAALVADILDRQAATALDAQRQAAQAVRQAKLKAESAAAAQQRTLSEITAQQNMLLAELAAARRTSVALERARQQGLAEEAAKRAAAALAREQGGGLAFPPGGFAQGTTAGAARAIAYARAQLGKPYVWAAAGPWSFDCSGLTMMAWRAGGVGLPHYSVAQYQQVKHIGRGSLRPGDLIFWSASPYDPGTIYHVALYIGADLMIEAPRTGDVVKVASMYIMGIPDFYGRP
jgi:cell wall-associated NlpC family hydrolase